eukprot:Gb_29739 [translate_table: standard]
MGRTRFHMIRSFHYTCRHNVNTTYFSSNSCYYFLEIFCLFRLYIVSSSNSVYPIVPVLLLTCYCVMYFLNEAGCSSFLQYKLNLDVDHGWS